MTEHGANWRTFPPNIPHEFLRVFDPYQHSVTVVSDQHRLIHDGMIFNWTGKSTLAAGATASFLFVPGDTPIHMTRATFFIEDGPATWLAYEDPTVTANGSLVADVKNPNRNSSNTMEGLLYAGTTYSDPGTLIHTTWTPSAGGTGGHPAGIRNIEQGEEWVLAPGHTYLFLFTNDSAGAIIYAWDMLMYELSYQNK